ncbi:MAG: bifunctional riboflavin kinase/FAD synthetase [Gemmatimonadota bacterium]|nr:bifunctional riboflavin kinase/FAD synthetase [Gemmatimonadota bacterium]MDH5804275.1 bifunctional riboflavin kinase/FAD synthetase [Gemmatimonadota bacterium]
MARVVPWGTNQGSVVTVGTFDGVHLGHRAILKEIKERAQRQNLKSVLVTFEPHPLEVVNPQAAPARLTVGDERTEVLAQCGLDLVAFWQFTKDLAQYQPEEFVSLLIDRYKMEELVIGHDHGFGKGRSGDEAFLRKMGGKRGFRVDVVGEVEHEGHPVSSTLIRRAVAGGDLNTAQALLGRRYSVTGTVRKGQSRGTELGFPTINVKLDDGRKLLPPDGVYAVTVERLGGIGGGMMHQGPRPTFQDTDHAVEVHLFDVNEDMYGQKVKISWVERIRDIRQFESGEKLRAQLKKDKETALSALTGGR